MAVSQAKLAWLRILIGFVFSRASTGSCLVPRLQYFAAVNCFGSRGPGRSIQIRHRNNWLWRPRRKLIGSRFYIFPRFLSGFVFFRTCLPVLYEFSRVFLVVLCFPALACRFCVHTGVDKNKQRWLALSTLLFWDYLLKFCCIASPN